MLTGKVKRFNEFRGWGFITGTDGNDYFVHYSEINAKGYKTLAVSEKVQFDVSTHRWGGHLPQAVNVSVIPPQGITQPSTPLPTTTLKSTVPSAAVSPAPPVVPKAAALKDIPFNPQDPVTEPSKFAGRREPLRNAVDALFNNKNIIVTGDRGIGKSSLAVQLLYMTQGERALLERLGVSTDGFEFNYLTGDHRCDPGQTLEDILEGLVESLQHRLATANKSKKKTTVEFNLKVFKVKRETETGQPEKPRLVPAFVRMLEAVYTEASSAGFNGLSLLVDEIDSLSKDTQVYTEVAYFFKGTTEKLRADGFPNISFLVAGVTGTVTDLMTGNPSFARVFENIELRRMEETELLDIIAKALSGTAVRIEPATATRVAKLSGGFPQIVQLLGYHSFRFDQDSVLNETDLEKALAYVVRELKRQEFEYLKTRAERSIRRAKILKILAEEETRPLSVGEVARRTALEPRVVASLMREMASPESFRPLLAKSGHDYYRFQDPLFRIYFRWASGLSSWKEVDQRQSKT